MGKCPIVRLLYFPQFKPGFTTWLFLYLKIIDGEVEYENSTANTN